MRRLTNLLAACAALAIPLQAQDSATPPPYGGASGGASNEGHFEGDGHDHSEHDGHEHAAHGEGFDAAAHAAAMAGQTPPAERQMRPGPYTERTRDLAASLAIQDGGRVKPLSTYADFLLLRLNGMRSVKLDKDTGDEHKLPSIEWLLDSLFYPAQAKDYPVFLIENPEVLDAIGISQGTKRVRDRYSLTELEPGLPKLLELGGEYHQIDQKRRTTLQGQIVTLRNNVWEYGSVFGAPDSISIVPPRDAEDDEWGPLVADSESYRPFAELVYARDDMGQFEEKLAALQGSLVTRATQRGEYGKIDLERTYYRLKPVPRSLYLYILAFVAAAFLWLKPRSKALHRSTLWLVGGGTAMLVFGIVMRCLIRGRPPVSTLYETVLFVVAVGSLTAIVTELINRQRIAISTAAVLGMVGMFVANGYEMLDKQDTMPSLVAVLDTNFWLAIHVTCITAGYSAGMLAAFLASVYLIAKALRLRRDEPSFYKNTARMVYGTTCFALIFSLVGTILGGVWANDSWGRFWGWDPKENGALLICISQIALLHGRMGGYLRDHGICMAAAFGGTVIAFSWWGVNLLGVGLHSYGFTSGIAKALWIYYGIQWGIVALGGVTALGERADARAAARAS